MREIEFCMKYANTCKLCPLNRICEDEYQREQEGGECGEKDLSVLRCGGRESHLPFQEKPTEKR